MSFHRDKITTASQNEISHFSSLANQWWAEDGKFEALHKINPIRLNFLYNQIITYFSLSNSSLLPLEGLKILDIGCGGGLLSEPLTRLGADVTGIDASEESIIAARKHANDANLSIEYLNSLPEKLLCDSRTFDLVINMEIIEHVSDFASFMKTSSALIKPGGAMALSTINRSIKSLILGKLAAEYILRWVPKGTHDWRKFVKPSELAAELRQNNLTLSKVEGINFDILKGGWQPSSDLSINYMAFAYKA